ncbi:MAG: nuclease, partial [Aquificaceae bacterium]
MGKRYSISLSFHQPAEIEVVEVEESEQFVNFYEEPKIYQGVKVEANINLIFVDGVRRTEGLVYIRDESTGDSFEGAFVSLGAGALRLSYGRFNPLEDALVENEVRRLLFVRGNLSLDEILGFKPVCVDGDISSEVNRYMKDNVEAEVAL